MYPTRVADRSQDVAAAELGAQADRRSVIAVLSGDRQAFRSLVERHQRGVYNVIRRLVHNTADAEDLAQQAFVSAFDALGSFRVDARFSSWLYRIAVNLAKDHLKSRRRDEVPTEDSEPAQALFSGSLPSPDEPATSTERNRLLQDALASLTYKDREVLVLKDIEELSYEEMREILHRPITAMKIRVVRARARLKSELVRRAGRGAL
jgi:RNA polymerase sigma-70 factor (ECF subfamily)